MFASLGAVVPCAARAQDKRGLDGTWGGAANGVTAQVIIVGTRVIGFFWRKDISTPGSRLSPPTVKNCRLTFAAETRA